MATRVWKIENLSFTSSEGPSFLTGSEQTCRRSRKAGFSRRNCSASCLVPLAYGTELKRAHPARRAGQLALIPRSVGLASLTDSCQSKAKRSGWLETKADKSPALAIRRSTFSAPGRCFSRRIPAFKITSFTERLRLDRRTRRNQSCTRDGRNRRCAAALQEEKSARSLVCARSRQQRPGGGRDCARMPRRSWSGLPRPACPQRRERLSTRWKRKMPPYRSDTR